MATYVNGALASTQPYTTPFGGFDRFWFGSRQAGGAYYQGGLDELALYSRALSDDEVRALANPVQSSIQSIEIRLIHAMNLENPPVSPWSAAIVNNTASGLATWSYPVPSGIEGPYQADLRTTDGQGNQHVIPNVWNGEIDTRSPQVALFTQSLPDGSAKVYCLAKDYNLDGDAITCAAPSPSWQWGYQAAPWYQAIFSPTQKLESMRATAVVPAGSVLSLLACDLFANCATAQPNTSASIAPGVSIILRPTGSQLVNTLDPIVVGGYAYAKAGLLSVQVTAGSTTIATPQLGASQTELAWDTTFTPASEGIYSIQARVSDKNGAVYTETLEPVVAIDLAAPELALMTSAITGTTMLPGGLAVISGLVTETHGLQTLAVQVDGGEWQALAVPAPGIARQLGGPVVLSGAGPFDGQQATVALRARDIVNRETTITRVVALDNVAPALTNITVTPSSTQARIEGLAGDAGSVRAIEVGLLPIQHRDHPEQIVWHSATLAQPSAMSTTWSLLVPAGAERSFRGAVPVPPGRL